MKIGSNNFLPRTAGKPFYQRMVGKTLGEIRSARSLGLKTYLPDAVLRAGFFAFQKLEGRQPGFLNPSNVYCEKQIVPFLQATKFFDLIAGGVFIINMSGEFVYANYPALKLFGDPDAKTANIVELLTEDSLSLARDKIRSGKTDDPRETLFLTLKRLDGSIVPIEVTPRLMKFKDGGYIFGTVKPSVLSAIQDLHQTIPRSHNMEEVYHLVLRHAAKIFRLDAASIKTDFDEASNSFRVLASTGLDAEYSLPRDKDLLSTASYQAFNSGKIAEKENMDDRTSSSAKAGMKFGMYVPLWVATGQAADGKPIHDKIGTFCLYVKGKKDFLSLQRKIHQIELFANFVAIRIREARLYARELFEKESYAALSKISNAINSTLNIDRILDMLVREAAVLFDKGSSGVRSCSVYMFNEEAGELKRLAQVGRDFSRSDIIRLGDGVTGKVAEAKVPFIVADVQDYVREYKEKNGVRKGSFMSTPIMTSGKLIGVLNISSEEEKYFNDRDLQVFQMLADMAATAIRNAHAHETIKLQTIVDNLIPDILNQRFGPFMLAFELDQATQNRTPYSLVMLDLDNFKKVNDEHDHLSGDRVLRAVGGVLAGLARKRGINLVYRFGGEEFVVGLPGHDIERARDFAEDVRGSIEGLTVKTDRGDDIKVTVSVGVSGISKVVRDRTILIKKADEAMLWAKKEGKNRVVVAERGIDLVAAAHRG